VWNLVLFFILLHDSSVKKEMKGGRFSVFVIKFKVPISDLLCFLFFVCLVISIH
jgi:hypothetical protein